MKNSRHSSHTHCQVAQADTQAKTWQRVCLPHPEKIDLKKFPFPSENKKYAIAQPNDRQKSAAMQTPKPLTVKRFNYSVDRRPACNSTYKKLAAQWLNEALCFVSSFVVAVSLVLRNRQLLVAANRYIHISSTVLPARSPRFLKNFFSCTLGPHSLSLRNG